MRQAIISVKVWVILTPFVHFSSYSETVNAISFDWTHFDPLMQYVVHLCSAVNASVSLILIILTR